MNSDQEEGMYEYCPRCGESHGRGECQYENVPVEYYLGEPMPPHVECLDCGRGIERASVLEMAERIRAVDAVSAPGDAQNDRLRRRIAELEEALRELHDEQNGPPLVRRKKEWYAAMDRARRVLAEGKGEP